jgi:hypothetical protein
VAGLDDTAILDAWRKAVGNRSLAAMLGD